MVGHWYARACVLRGVEGVERQRDYASALALLDAANREVTEIAP